MNYKLFIVIACALLPVIGNAQNFPLAKAFFKKAQEEYSQKNYNQVLVLLDKTKEQLNGGSNLEMTLLEAKARYHTDINVAEAKKLFTEFLEDPDAFGVDEVASILVEIELSDEIDDYGNFNDVTGRSGIKVEHYDTGEKRREREYLNGSQSGTFKSYYKDGILKQSGIQINGKLNGLYEFFDEKGKLSQTRYYENGSRIKETKLYNNKGEVWTIFTYANNEKNGIYQSFKDGKLIKEGIYKDGKANGKFTEYYHVPKECENKYICNIYTESTYVNGKLQGNFTRYHFNGKISSTYTYSNAPSHDTEIKSFIEGVAFEYYETGIKQLERNYVNGELVGIQKAYYRNGNLNRKENLIEGGYRHGEYSEYYESNGQLALNINYENGKFEELLEQYDVKGNKIKVSKIKKGNGYIIRWNESNIIISEANIVNGEKNGLVKEYYDNGNLKKELNFSNGTTNGEIISYHDNGIIEYIVNNKEGFRTGIMKSYRSDGNLSRVYDCDSRKDITAKFIDDLYLPILDLLKDKKTIEDIIDYCKNNNHSTIEYNLPEEVLAALGVSLVGNNRLEDALEIFKLNLEYYPEDWRTHHLYGKYLARQGSKEEAIIAYKKALELNPKSESAMKALKELDR